MFRAFRVARASADDINSTRLPGERRARRFHGTLAVSLDFSARLRAIVVRTAHVPQAPRSQRRRHGHCRRRRQHAGQVMHRPARLRARGCRQRPRASCCFGLAVPAPTCAPAPLVRFSTCYSLLQPAAEARIPLHTRMKKSGSACSRPCVAKSVLTGVHQGWPSLERQV